MSGALGIWLFVAWVAGLAAGDAAPRPAQLRDLQFALSMLLYVASDYQAAVRDDGTILDRSEYVEQIEFVGRVEGVLRGAGAGAEAVLPQLEALRADIAAHRPPRQVEARVREVRARIVATFHIEIAPQEVPSLVAGRILYAHSCVECHGDDGRARTPRDAQLKPRPANLLAPKLNANLSPAQVFDVVSFGIPGTAMASFETLEESERWDLAFYVLALRHPDAPTDREPPALQLSLRELAQATDAELERKLQHLPAARRPVELARLRRVLPLNTAD